MIDGLPDAHEVPHHRMTPIVKALLAAVAFTILLLALFYWQSRQEADELHDKADALSETVGTSDDVIGDLAGDVEALRSQLLGLGERPVAPDPEVTIREVVGPVGPAGAPGVGIQGVAGRDGRDGTDGITPACWFEQAQCQGADGTDGIDGNDGADSTVPGPQGPAGDDGADGAPGPACPAGYEPRVIEQGPNQGWIACAPVG